MTWINYWLKYANYDEIKKEAERRGMFTPPAIPPPKIYGTITAGELVELLPKTYVGFDNNTYAVRKEIGYNTQYNLTSIDEIKRWLAWNQIDKREYKLDAWDCNTFAIATWGAYLLWGENTVFGAVITGGHMMNWALDYQRTKWRIEPQSDVITKGFAEDSAHFFLSSREEEKTVA